MDLFKTNRVLSVYVTYFLLFATCSFGVRLRWLFLLMLFSVVLVAFVTKTTKIIIGNNIKTWICITSACVFFSLCPNARYEEDSLICIVCLIITTVVILLCRTNIAEGLLIEKILLRVAVFVALYITFFRIFPDIYISVVVPYLDREVANKVVHNFSTGYGVMIGNSFVYGDYLIMAGIAFAVGKDITKKENNSVKEKLIIIALLFGMLMEGRKGELFSAIFAISLVYFIHSNLRKIKIQMRSILFLILFLLSFGFVLSNGVLDPFLVRFHIFFDRFSFQGAGNNIDFSSGRIQLWRTAFNLFLENPIIGVGWGNFAHYVTGVYSVDLVEIKHVHNVLLELLCEIGILGTSMVLGPLFYLVHSIYQHTLVIRKKRYVNYLESKWNIFAITMLVFYLTLSFFDPIFYGVAFWCMLLIVLIFENLSLKIADRNPESFCHF